MQPYERRAIPHRRVRISWTSVTLHQTEEARMRLLATIGALAIVFGIGCAVFFFGGYYSVAGTAEALAAVTWALTKVPVRVRQSPRHPQSASPRSATTPWCRPARRPMPADGCANCHGTPGVMWLKYSEGLHPDPPDLEEGRRRRLPSPVVLDHQERHQHDWHAELRAGRRQGRRDLVDRGIRQEATCCFRSGLQELDRVGRTEAVSRSSRSARALRPYRRVPV